MQCQVTYLFAIIGFVCFWNYYDDYTKTCSTLYQCTVSSIAEGFKSDGVADLLQSQIETLGFPKHLWSDWDLLALMLWNLAFFLVVVLILVAVFTGIIIDSFGDQRDKQNEKDERLSSSCVICGLPRERFVQCPGASFNIHISDSHHVLSYLCYFLYLKEQERDECTPQELYMQSCLARDSISFFPIERTLDLRNEIREDETNALHEKLDSLTNQVTELSQRLLRYNLADQQEAV